MRHVFGANHPTRGHSTVLGSNRRRLPQGKLLLCQTSNKKWDKEEEGEEEKQKLAGTPGALEQASKPAKLCEWRGSFKIRFSRKKKHPISLPDLLGWLYPLKIWESKMTFHQSSEPPCIFFQTIFSSTNLSESFVESSNSNWLKFPNPFFSQTGWR